MFCYQIHALHDIHLMIWKVVISQWAKRNAQSRYFFPSIVISFEMVKTRFYNNNVIQCNAVNSLQDKSSIFNALSLRWIISPFPLVICLSALLFFPPYQLNILLLAIAFLR